MKTRARVHDFALQLAIALCSLFGMSVAVAADAGWMSTWSAAPDSAGPALKAQTLRQIARVSVGGKHVRIHLSNLILSGQMTRAEAIGELSLELYPARKLAEDKQFVAKKLGISLEEFEHILSAPPHLHEEYPTNTELVRKYQAATAWLRARLPLRRGVR